MGAERRRHPRVPSDLTLAIALEDGTHKARLRDISAAGLCFFLDRPLEEMTILQVAFDVPHGPEGHGLFAVRTTGVVVRCLRIGPAVDHYEVALFFNGLDEDARAALHAFVATREG